MSSEKLVVLDAWPVVEYYDGKNPSAIEMDRLLSDKTTEAVMCSVNFAEVYSAMASNARDFTVAMKFVESLKGVVTIEEPSAEVEPPQVLRSLCQSMGLGRVISPAT